MNFEIAILAVVLLRQLRNTLDSPKVLIHAKARRASGPDRGAIGF